MPCFKSSSFLSKFCSFNAVEIKLSPTKALFSSVVNKALQSLLTLIDLSLIIWAVLPESGYWSISIEASSIFLINTLCVALTKSLNSKDMNSYWKGLFNFFHNLANILGSLSNEMMSSKLITSTVLSKSVYRFFKEFLSIISKLSLSSYDNSSTNCTYSYNT